MNPENRNMILAISLSMAVLFGWQVFVVGPELDQEAALHADMLGGESADHVVGGDAEDYGDVGSGCVFGRDDQLFGVYVGAVLDDVASYGGKLDEGERGDSF